MAQQKERELMSGSPLNIGSPCRTGIENTIEILKSASAGNHMSVYPKENVNQTQSAPRKST